MVGVQWLVQGFVSRLHPFSIANGCVLCTLFRPNPIDTRLPAPALIVPDRFEHPGNAQLLTYRPDLPLLVTRFPRDTGHTWEAKPRVIRMIREEEKQQLFILWMHNSHT